MTDNHVSHLENELKKKEEEILQLKKQIATFESLAEAASKYMKEEEILESYYTPFVNIVKSLRTDKPLDRNYKEFFTLRQWLSREATTLNSKQKVNFQIACSVIYKMVRGVKPPKEVFDYYNHVSGNTYVYSSYDETILRNCLEAVLDLIGDLDPEIQDLTEVSVIELISLAGFDVPPYDPLIYTINVYLMQLINCGDLPNHRSYSDKFYPSEKIIYAVKRYLTNAFKMQNKRKK